MNKIEKLQRLLDLKITGIFDENTIDIATENSNKPEVIGWVQEFLNSLDHNVKVGSVTMLSHNSYYVTLSNKFDRATRDLLTFFQKEYGYEYLPIPVTATLDHDTWKLIATYCNKNN